MSNKMLTKRLLAAGMSVAMSAMLFATNSLTTFAVEDAPELSAPVQAEAPDPEPTGGDEYDAPEETPTEQKDPDNYSEVVFNFENQCTGDVYRVVKTVETEDEYYSDENSTNEDGSQSNEYKESTQEATEGQTLDYTEIEKIRSQEATVYLEDCKGNEVTVPDEDGKQVRLELPENFKRSDLKPVLAVENPDGSYHELNGCEAWGVFYGFFEEETGKFVPTYATDRRAQAYIIDGVDEDGNDIYKVADTMYLTVDKCGRTVFLDEEVYKALKGEESIYTAQKEYIYEGEVYTDKELDELEQIKEVGDWDYTISGSPEVIDKTEKIHFYKEEPAGPPAPVHPVLAGPADKDKADPKPKEDHPVKVEITGYQIIGTKVHNTPNGAKYPAYLYFERNGETYVVEGTIEIPDKNAKVGDKDDIRPTPLRINTKDDTVYKVTPEVKEKKKDTVVISVYNGEELIWQGDKTQYDKLMAFNVAEADKFKVKDADGNDQYIDQKYYKIIHELEDKLEVTRSYYYTVQDKTEKRVVEFDMGDQNYKLNIGFWQNSRIGITGVDVVPNEDGTMKIVVSYAYSSYADDGVTPVIGNGTFEYDVDDGMFGAAGEANLTIKYNPVYTATNEFPRDIVIPKEFLTKSNLPKDMLLKVSATDGNTITLRELIELYSPEMLEKDDLYHTVDLGEPIFDIAKVEPAPRPTPPTPTPDEPTTTTIEETTVALAPTGAVLGAQRATEEGGAVLGASRAAGTADETTAPIVRVLVMAAVAGTALFLTRKREENN